MKRTFLVTIEGIQGNHAGTIQRYVEDAFPWFCVNVAETTATHAKEKEVIKAALAQLEACERNNRWIDSTTDTEDKARELRALMEKQP